MTRDEIIEALETLIRANDGDMIDAEGRGHDYVYRKRHDLLRKIIAALYDEWDIKS